MSAHIFYLLKAREEPVTTRHFDYTKGVLLGIAPMLIIWASIKLAV
ncbi:MAG TPA: hypothetical protein VK666_27000 [Chryseolinea sp.]|nr:hypothetical protein [Chryseolinea sp.]